MLSFKKGDALEILEGGDDWSLAKKVSSGEEGWIPSSFVQA